MALNGLELLRLAASAANGRIAADQMPDTALRFVLEYQRKPDINDEHRRIALLVGAEAFSLRMLDESPDSNLGRFLVLQFPGTVAGLSVRARFEMANALVSALELISCEPDLASRIYGEPDARDLAPSRPEGVIIDLWCSSTAEPPLDTRWALAAIRAQQAWQLSPAKGEGVIVGQPDTGVAAHTELEGDALVLNKAKNILEGGVDPTDPLSANMANPGHGTATSSVVISREAGQMTGVAPGAKLAPIRCINDVKIFNGAPVAAAVAHARKAGCDVISLSLGGVWSSALSAAIRDAVDNGCIVVAAAGNCVGFVVYPGFDNNVIAAAGVDINDKPWKGTSAGSTVDVAAPAENVYVARRRPGDGGEAKVTGGQGTSFATAIIAGVAALWLSHHGRTAVMAEAARRNVSVQTLFRSALQQTARRPAGWKPSKHGAGIANAEALLRLKLADIPTPGLRAPKNDGAISEISRLARERAMVDGFDWARHGAEATWLAAQAEIISRRSQAGIETLGIGVLRPSTEVAVTAPPVLRRLLGAAELEAAPPANMVTRSVTNNERYLKIAGKQSGGGLESAAAISIEVARNRLSGSHAKELIEKMQRTLEKLPASDAATTAERGKAAEAATSGLRKLANDGLTAELSVTERIGLEALINIHDRPALKIVDGGVNSTDPLLGDWGGQLLPAKAALQPAMAAVGRINLDDGHVGTGFVIAPDRIMTNRHVLEAIGEEFPLVAGGSRWVFTGEVTINFAENGRTAASSFKVTGVIAAGPNRIDETVDFTHLDMAVLEVESVNGMGVALPKALGLVADGTIAERRSEFLIAGYPARPGINALRDPDTGQVRDDVVARLGKIFGFAYSVKYLSPGEIDFPLGKLAGDRHAWVFAHDATTLGGNSGSCVIHLGDPFGVIGLHFGGGTLRANYAHGLVATRNAKVLAAAGLDGTTWI